MSDAELPVVPELPPTPQGAGGLWVFDDATQQLQSVPVESPAPPDATPEE